MKGESCLCMVLGLRVKFYAFYAHLYVNGDPNMLKLIYVTCCAVKYIYISLVAVV